MEADYRNRIQSIFNQIEKAFDQVDPDLAECEQILGSLTITFPDKSKCILSAQPSVSQLWLALSSRGMAYHFNYHEVSKTWVDDKGQGIELISLLKTFLKESTGLEFTI